MRLPDERWAQCVEFHGHECSGLVIGYKAALYAEEVLGLGPSVDEEIVTVSECDACCVDAFQKMFSCTVGKGNLIFHMTGKWAFTFFDRKRDKALRLALNYYDGDDVDAADDYYFDADYHDLFRVTEPRIALPETARMFRSVPCDICGEKAAENHIHLENGKRICEDCYVAYNRPLL